MYKLVMFTKALVEHTLFFFAYRSNFFINVIYAWYVYLSALIREFESFSHHELNLSENDETMTVRSM